VYLSLSLSLFLFLLIDCNEIKLVHSTTHEQQLTHLSKCSEKFAALSEKSDISQTFVDLNVEDEAPDLIDIRLKESIRQRNHARVATLVKFNPGAASKEINSSCFEVYA